jgi:NAD-dependent dihydropyrimidine dehydrogenase PreA subunit
MADFKIIRDKDTCIGCNECIIVCAQSDEKNPNSVITRAKTKGDPPEVSNYDNCIQCMRCADHCRSHAITFENAHVVEILIRNLRVEKEVRKII